MNSARFSQRDNCFQSAHSQFFLALVQCRPKSTTVTMKWGCLKYIAKYSCKETSTFILHSNRQDSQTECRSRSAGISMSSDMDLHLLLFSEITLYKWKREKCRSRSDDACASCTLFAQAIKVYMEESFKRNYCNSKDNIIIFTNKQ